MAGRLEPKRRRLRRSSSESPASWLQREAAEQPGVLVDAPARAQAAGVGAPQLLGEPPALRALGFDSGSDSDDNLAALAAEDPRLAARVALGALQILKN